jgi:hypothetical protein
MTGLALNYGRCLNTEDGRALMRIFWAGLCVYPDEAVERAFVEVARRCKWFPTLADFIEALEPRKNAAKAAWGEVLVALGHYGGLRNQYWLAEGALAAAVETLGGWAHLARRSAYELNLLGPAFEAAWERAAAAGLNLHQGRVAGERDRDWRTGELRPLTLAPPRRNFLPDGEASASRREILTDGETSASRREILTDGETSERMEQ